MLKFFKLNEHNTNLRTEIIAGVTTFMTMAYIIFVNPEILGDAGMPEGAVMTATILTAGFTTIIMALLTNYPFAMASGMGLNAFFAYTVAAQYDWQTALGAVFLSGIVFGVLALTGLIHFIDAAVPATLKRAVAAGIGLFIAFIGLNNGEIINFYNGDNGGIELAENLTASAPLLTLIGLLITALLMARRIKGAILLGILLTTIVGFFMGVRDFPTGWDDIFGMPASLGPIALQLDFAAILTIPFFVIFSFIFVDVFDTMGTLLGTGARAGFLDDKGRLPKVNRAMLADAIGTTGGALLGTSTVTTYVESTAGISVGGRTGLTSIVTGILFLLTLFLAPMAGLVPSSATAPALIIVGVLMVGAVAKIDFEDFTEAFPAFLTIIFMPFAYSIADGIAFGFIAYPVVKLVAGKTREVHWLVYLLAVISLIHFFYPAG